MAKTIHLMEYMCSNILMYFYNGSILLSDPMSILAKDASKHTFKF